jgi:aspartate/methionine/tyrosine aminotransferase
MLGVFRVHAYSLQDASQSLCFSVDELRALMRPNTKLLVVNFPHNPTGCLPSAQDWESIVAACRYVCVHVRCGYCLCCCGACIGERSHCLRLCTLRLGGSRLLHEPFSLSACRDIGCFLFSDEMYRGMELHPDSRLTSAVDCYVKAVVLGGLSKAAGLPGLRIGWLVSSQHTGDGSPAHDHLVGKTAHCSQCRNSFQ